jgi:segregation and condensation protein A
LVNKSEIRNPKSEIPYEVHLEIFEGPLDLLLKLIERKQLDISKVALAEVAGGFLAYLEAHPDMPPGPMASFVWVASKLIWLKSQGLLPKPPTVRSEDDDEDPGDELVRRLEAYKRVQEAARWLRDRESKGLRSYERPISLRDERLTLISQQDRPLDNGLNGVTLARLLKMVQKRMQLQMSTVPVANAPTRGHVITVAEKVAHLRKRLNKLKEGERIPLGEEFVNAASLSRTDLVVLFLAVLEVIRRKLGVAEQDELFGEIWLVREG